MPKSRPRAHLIALLLSLLATAACDKNDKRPQPVNERPQPVEEHAPAPAPAKRPPPRVILISLDTHAMNAMSLPEHGSGLDTSPALRKLASQPGAVLFTHALSGSSWTKPTHATVFTGVYPSQHGQIGHTLETSLGDEPPTLYQLLHRSGVKTVHLASHLRLDERRGYRRGTDKYKMYAQRLGKRGRKLLDDAIATLRKHPDGPLFMFLHLYDAHSPYTNYPRNYRKYYAGPKPDGTTYYRDKRYRRMVERGRFPKTLAKNRRELAAYLDPKMPGSRAAYRLGIRDVDDMLGRFLKRLKKAGQFADTTLIFFADHGEEFFEHGLLTHNTLYQPNLRVPVLIKLAKGSPYAQPLDGKSRVVDHTFEADTTLYGVVLSLFGVNAPPQVRAASTNAVPLSELLTLDEDRDAFAETYHVMGSTHEAVLVSGGRALHMFTELNDDLTLQPEHRAFQLFDLRDDPWEARDLYPRRKQQVAPLRKRMLQKVRTLVVERREAPRDVTLSDAEQDRLRALGYVQ